MIRAVIFDCFGVLYVPVGEDYFRSHIPNFEMHKAELADLGRQADYGLISQQDLADQVAGLVGLPAAEVRANIMGQLIRNQALLAFSQSLRPKYKVGLLSNISRATMDNYFSLSERQQFFDSVVLSSDVGMVKPHPEIFELAAQRLGVDASECIFVDDNAANCAGAQSVGMQVVVYQSAKQAMGDIGQLLSKNL